MAQIRCLNEAHGDRFTVYNGDCVDIVGQLPDSSVDFSVYSPPFGSLFVYSESAADMGTRLTSATAWGRLRPTIFTVSTTIGFPLPGAFVSSACAPTETLVIPAASANTAIARMSTSRTPEYDARARERQGAGAGAGASRDQKGSL